MTTHKSIDAINRVMNALRYSLVSYLRFARPWVDADAQSLKTTIKDIAKQHRKHVMRIGKLLLSRYGHVESRTFPIAFGSLNDLSIEFLLPLVIEDERQIIRLVETSADALQSDAEVFGLMVDVLATETRHIELLQTATKPRRAIESAKSSALERCRSPQWTIENEQRHLRAPRGIRGTAMQPRLQKPSRQHQPSALSHGRKSPC